MKKIVSKPLGEILVENKMITQDQLDEGLKIQKTKGGLLGEILVERGHLTEDAIAKTLTVQYGFPYLPLSGYEIDPEVAKIIPKEMAIKNQLIAVDRVGAILTIAMANPLNAAAIEEVEQKTHLKVQLFISTNTDIKETIMRCYPAEEKK